MSDLVLRAHTAIRTEMEEKRSRFITALVRVDSEEEARAVINDERAAYPDARHHCSAYIVSQPGAQPVLRSSDDGEPSGTAGRPMLETLEGAHIVDAVAVVTRYFGGTLLGTGGLVRAYSSSVQRALDEATLATRTEVPAFEALLPHADAGRYLATLQAAGFAAHPNYVASGVHVRIATSQAERLAGLLAELSGGAIKPIPAGTDTVEEPVF